MIMANKDSILWGGLGIFLKIFMSFAFLLLIAHAIVYVSFWIEPEAHGSYSLGNGIYAIDMSSRSREIVLCTRLDGNTCISGSPLTQLLLNPKIWFDDDWVVVIGSNERRQMKYYIMNKDIEQKDAVSLRKGLDPKTDENEKWINKVENNMLEFNDSLEFKAKCSELGIMIENLRALE